MDQAGDTTGIMSDVSVPASVTGGSDTVATGAVHPSGGSHVDLLGNPGMQFLGAGGLQVEFVDLTAAGPAARDAGPISFTDWQPSGASVPAGGLDAAANQAAGVMLADFAAGSGNGLPGGAMQPDAPGRTGRSRFGDPGMPSAKWMVPPAKLP